MKFLWVITIPLLFILQSCQCQVASENKEFDRIIESYKREWLYSNENECVNIDSIMKAVPMFLTCVCYNWNDSLHMTFWGNLSGPLLFHRREYLKGMFFQNRDCIFVFCIDCQQTEIPNIPNLYKDNIFSLFSSRYQDLDYVKIWLQDDCYMMYSWDGDPYEQEYIFKDSDWKMQGKGYGLSKCYKKVKLLNYNDQDTQ